MAAKKIQQPPPDYEGRTQRHCKKCGMVIRTRRQVYCQGCHRKTISGSMTEEKLDLLDSRAVDLGYESWYAFTDFIPVSKK